MGRATRGKGTKSIIRVADAREAYGAKKIDYSDLIELRRTCLPEATMNNRDINQIPDGRAELLCFLVATAAASYALTQEWRVDHVVANGRAWLARHLVSMDWLERVEIGQLALKIAERELLTAGIAVRLSSVQALFTDEMGLNYSSTMIQRMLNLCRERAESL